MSEGAASEDEAAPEGFRRHTHHSPLTDPWEPLFVGRSAIGWPKLGVRLREVHTNRRGMAHGGLIAALADNTMGMACYVATVSKGFDPPGLVTVSLQVDYMGRAELGQWIVFEPTFIKIGRTISFANLEVTADGKPIAKASATFASA